MRRVLAIALSAGVGVLLGLGAIPLVEPRLPASPVLRGLKVGGEPVPSGVEPGSWLKAERRRLGSKPLVLQHGERRYGVTLAELGVELDVGATLANAVAPGHGGSLVRRLRETAQARRGALGVPLRWRFDEDSARQTLARFADDLRRAPVDAELDLEGHRRIPDQPGQELDVEATMAEIRARAVVVDVVDLVGKPVPARVTLSDLDDIDVSRVLGRFETKFASFKVGRAANVAKAAGMLNGLVMRPGETVSFNDRVGPRTIERGFQFAPEIVGDELTIGVGGGTCQVASTLHAAAVYGGLEVVERKSHSRPSDYTQLGLDATVAYRAVDLRLRNPYSFTVVVHALVPQPGLLRIELLGGEAVDKVEYKYGIAHVEEFVRRITVKPFLKNGRVMRWQKGTRGMDVFSTVTVTYRDGRVETRQYYSGYRPSPEVFWVSSDYDPTALPELPQYARGVEGQLHRDGSDVYPTL